MRKGREEVGDVEVWDCCCGDGWERNWKSGGEKGNAAKQPSYELRLGGDFFGLSAITLLVGEGGVARGWIGDDKLQNTVA